MDTRIEQIAQRNIGALRVLRDLQYFSAYNAILNWLIKNDIASDALWEIYSDEYRRSVTLLGENIIGLIRAGKQEWTPEENLQKLKQRWCSEVFLKELERETPESQS